MLTLQSNSLAIRAYTWSRLVWCHFVETNPRNDSGLTPRNLCQLVRTVFVLMPMAFALNAAAAIWAGYVLLYLPVTTMSWGSAANFLMVFGGIAAILGAAYGLILLVEWAANRSSERRSYERSAEPQKSLAWEYLKARKAAICPLITVEG